jgi:hypothetical protein
MDFSKDQNPVDFKDLWGADDSNSSNDEFPFHTFPEADAINSSPQKNEWYEDEVIDSPPLPLSPLRKRKRDSFIDSTSLKYARHPTRFSRKQQSRDGLGRFIKMKSSQSGQGRVMQSREGKRRSMIRKVKRAQPRNANGQFMSFESPSDDNGIIGIKQILKTRKMKGDVYHFVRWENPDFPDSWIPNDDLASETEEEEEEEEEI